MRALQPISRRMALAALAALWASPRVPAAAARIARWDPAKPTPSLDLESVDGERWELSALRGKVGVLNFWASWCEPCVAEIPQLNAMVRRHEHDALLVLGINYCESREAIGRFIEGRPVRYPILRDPQGAAFRAWGGGVLPSSILVSQRGRARFAIQGQLDWESTPATRLLKSLLADKES